VSAYFFKIYDTQTVVSRGNDELAFLNYSLTGSSFT